MDAALADTDLTSVLGITAWGLLTASLAWGAAIFLSLVSEVLAVRGARAGKPARETREASAARATAVVAAPPPHNPASPSVEELESELTDEDWLAVLHLLREGVSKPSIYRMMRLRRAFRESAEYAARPRPAGASRTSAG